MGLDEKIGNPQWLSLMFIHFHEIARMGLMTAVPKKLLMTLGIYWTCYLHISPCEDIDICVFWHYSKYQGDLKGGIKQQTWLG